MDRPPLPLLLAAAVVALPLGCRRPAYAPPHAAGPQGGRAAEASPAGTYTLQGNAFDHRNVRGTLRFDGA